MAEERVTLCQATTNYGDQDTIYQCELQEDHEGKHEVNLGDTKGYGWGMLTWVDDEAEFRNLYGGTY